MQFIEVSSHEGVMTVTLNRPEVLNAINPVMHQELQSAFDHFASDPKQLICVVTGAGERAFCAGSDLRAVEVVQTYPKNGYAGLIERFDLAKPLIAAVNGIAFGGGFEIALACDLIIASDKSSFALPEPLVGAVALGGGLHRLARQIGLKNAMGMILSSRRVSADEGLRLGFVNEIVPANHLQEAVARWSESILKGAPKAINASKEAVLRGLDEPSLADAIQHQVNYPAFAAWRNSDEHREGPRAFAEKRTPPWQNH